VRGAQRRQGPQGRTPAAKRRGLTERAPRDNVGGSHGEEKQPGGEEGGFAVAGAKNEASNALPRAMRTTQAIAGFSLSRLIRAECLVLQIDIGVGVPPELDLLAHLGDANSERSRSQLSPGAADGLCGLLRMVVGTSRPGPMIGAVAFTRNHRESPGALLRSVSAENVEVVHCGATAEAGQRAFDRQLGRRGQRSDLKVARISSEKVCGCSQAAKCPPSSTSLKWTSFGYAFSAQLRGAG
jgi:hypothetical protein